MKQKFKVSVLLTSLFLVSSCGLNERELSVEYVNESEVDCKKIEIRKLMLDEEPLNPRSLCFVDSFLVVKDDDRQPNFILVYSNNALCGKFGKLGNGPTEMIAPMFLSEGICEQRYLTIGSSPGFMCFDIDEFVNNDTLICESEVVPEELSLCNSLLLNNDSLIIANCTGENQLEFYDKKGKSIKGLSYYDADFFSNKKISRFIYNIQVFPAVYGRVGNVIFIAYAMQKEMDLVSINGNHMKRLRFDNYDYNKNKIRKDNGNVIYDNDAIYFFCSCCSTEDAFYVVCQENMKSDTPKSVIYKFDGLGNLLIKYECDKVIAKPVVRNGIVYVISKSDEGGYELSYAVL